MLNISKSARHSTTSYYNVTYQENKLLFKNMIGLQKIINSKTGIFLSSWKKTVQWFSIFYSKYFQLRKRNLVAKNWNWHSITILYSLDVKKHHSFTVLLWHLVCGLERTLEFKLKTQKANPEYFLELLHQIRINPYAYNESQISLSLSPNFPFSLFSLIFRAS